MSEKSRLILFNTKVAPKDLAHWRKLAKRHTQGNVSALIREAIRVYTPPKSPTPKRSRAR